MHDKAKVDLVKAAKEASLALAPFVYGGRRGPARNLRIKRYQTLRAAIKLATQEGA